MRDWAGYTPEAGGVGICLDGHGTVCSNTWRCVPVDKEWVGFGVVVPGSDSGLERSRFPDGYRKIIGTCLFIFPLYNKTCLWIFLYSNITLFTSWSIGWLLELALSCWGELWTNPPVMRGSATWRKTPPSTRFSPDSCSSEYPFCSSTSLKRSRTNTTAITSSPRNCTRTGGSP